MANTIFTGVPDVDREILLKLSDNKLFRVCQLNTEISSLCDNTFWARRFEQKFGARIGEGSKVNYREQYKQYANLKYESQIELAINNHHNDLVRVFINKYIIPLLTSGDSDSNSFLVHKFLVKSIYADNIAVFVLLYKIAEEFEISLNMKELSIKAARYGKYSMVKFIVETLKYIPTNRTILEAAESKKINIVRFLHDKGLELNTRMFFYAINNEDIDMIKYLIENGIVLTNLNSESGAHVLNMGISVLSYLKDHGVDIINTSMILNNAIDHGNEKIVKWLIENGVDVNDESALANALINGKYNSAQLLIDAGAIINTEKVIDASLYRPHSLELLTSNGLSLIDNVKKISEVINRKYYLLTDDLLEKLVELAYKSAGEDSIFSEFIVNLVTGISGSEFRSLPYELGIIMNTLINLALKYVDVNINNGALLHMAIDMDLYNAVDTLLDKGANIFTPGDVAKIVIKNVHLAEKMFKSGAKLTDAVMNIINKHAKNMALDRVALLVKNGLKLSDNPLLLKNVTTVNGFGVSDEDLLLLHQNGVVFENKVLETKMRKLDPKSTKESTEPDKMVFCKGKTKSGTACKRKCSKKDEYCFAHK